MSTLCTDRPGTGIRPAARTALALAASAGLGLAALSGCNLFSPLAADRGDELAYRGLLIRGNEAGNAGRHAEAMRYYERAMAKYPAGSEAYLYHAKAVINLYGIDYPTLDAEFECKRTTRDPDLCRDRGIDTAGVPFVDSATTLADLDSLYYPVVLAVRDLEHILRKRDAAIPLGGGWQMLPDGDTASDGRVTDGVARLDLGILQAVAALLAPLDLDSNGRLEEPCGRNVCPDGSEECRAGAAYRARCREGDASEALRLDTFKKLTRRLRLDDLNSEDVNARYVSTNPNDINAFLDAMQGHVAGANYNLDSVTGAMRSHGEGEMAGRLSGMVSNINDLNSLLSYMRYDDGVDNDGDGRGGSPPGVMVWHDFDKDGAIRYDYDESHPGWPAEALLLGHPLHRHLRPELYLTFAEWSRSGPDIGADTSKASRKALMIDHCRDRAAGTPASAEFTEQERARVLAVTCTTYTSVLARDARRPDRSDWVGGPPGVDEEMVDQRDNDMDGLRDEDGRNAEGMDDDDDGALTVRMIGDPSLVVPMAWADAPGAANGCPDIDASAPMPEAPRERENCIGSLEHRIRLARTYGTDRASVDRADSLLASHYSRFTGTENGPHLNCLEDFGKLPAAYREQEGLGANDPAVRMACRFKHIWIRPRPEGSEWTGGVFGVDEEKPDGRDNDGDGWIDEDLE